MLRRSRKGFTSWPPQGPFLLGIRLHQILASPCAAPPLGRGSSAVMAMAQVQVLHDVLQSGIRWRVTLYACPDQGALLRFE